MNKFFAKIASLTAGLALVAGAGVALASHAEVKGVRAASVDVTFTVDKVHGNNTTASGADTMTYQNVTVSTTSGGFNCTEYRFGKSSTTTFSSSAGNITGIVFTCTASGTTKYGPGCFAAQEGYSYDGATGTWSGNSASVSFVAETNQVRASQIVVTYESGGEITNYTVTYDANGGSGTMADTVATNPVISECAFGAPDGKVFSSWNTESDGSGDEYAAGASVNLDLDLFAIWIDAPSGETGTINFGSSEGSTKIDSTSVSGDDSLGNTWEITTVMSQTSFTQNPAYSQVGSSAKPATSISFSMALSEQKKVTSFTAKFGGFSGTAGDISLNVDSTEVGTGSLNASTDVVITASNVEEVGTNLSIEVTNIAKGVKVYYVSYTIEDAGGEALKTMTIKQSGSDAAGQSYDWKNGTYTFEAYEESTKVSGVTWSVSDSEIATINSSTGALTPVKPGSVTVSAEAEGYKKASAAITISAGSVSSVVVSGSMSKTSYSVGEAWSHDGLTATVNYSTGYSHDGTEDAVWTYNPASPAIDVKSVVATATVGGQSGSSSAQAVTVTKTNPIQVLYTQTDGATVDIYAYYVGFLTGSGPIVMDGAYGILCYNKTADVDSFTEGETILHITGTMSTFNGLRQVANPSLSVASGTFDAPEEPVVYACRGGETVEYASRLTTVTGVATCTKNDFSGAAGANDITMNFAVGTKTVQVFYKKAAQTADTDAYATMKDAVEAGTEITVKGFTGWYNGFQVQMNGIVEAVEGYTAEDFAQDLLDQTDAICTGWQEGDNNHDELVAVWSNLQGVDKYPALSAEEKTVLEEAVADEEGSVVEQALARYEFLCIKYGLGQFIAGHDNLPEGRFSPISSTTFDSNTAIAVVAICAIASISAIAVILVIKRRKAFDR